MPFHVDIPQFLKDYGLMITWLIALGGWFFVRSDNNKREDRKELRKILDQLTDDIKSLARKAHTYYLSSIGDEATLLEIELVRDQADIEARVARLRRIYDRYHREDELSRFGQAVTGGDFQTATRTKKDANHKVFMQISYAARYLTDYLESEYEDQHPRTAKHSGKDVLRLPK